MSTLRNDVELKDKLGEIRKSLLENPTREQLEDLQLNLDLIATWDRLMASEPGHHHDHMDDHDHAQVAAPAVNQVRDVNQIRG
jgi:predicted glycoside hydrolase/deacetylase ChbG (UPF0249 family)